MEKSQCSLLKERSGSFSGREEKKKKCDRPSRNLSMNYIRSHLYYGSAINNVIDNNNNIADQENKSHPRHPLKIDEEPAEEEPQHPQNEHVQEKEEEENQISLQELTTIFDEIDVFLSTGAESNLPEVIPNSAVEKLAKFVEKEIAKLEITGAEDDDHSGVITLLEAIDKVSKLTAALGSFPIEPTTTATLNRTGTTLQKAMAFLEEELQSILEDTNTIQNSCNWTPKSSGSFTETEFTAAAAESGRPSDMFPPETVDKLHKIAEMMISAGYETECLQAFGISRHNAIEAAMVELGFEKISIDDVQKMGWETLESEIVKWRTAFRHFIDVLFPQDHELCEAVFSGHLSIATSIFDSLASGVVFQFLNFAEAVVMTKRSSEKLFKFLDMYETLRDIVPVIHTLLPSALAASAVENEEDGSSLSSSPLAELMEEVSSVRSRLGEASTKIFSDLENSIKSDAAKTPVPGGAVHPLTRYVMNYVKCAFEYKNTLVQVFEDYQHCNTQQQHKSETSSSPYSPYSDGSLENSNGHNPSSFSSQLMAVMDLLDGNLEEKSNLYKDQSLSYIFLMNNGRYIMQKIKGSPEIHELLGDAWVRKRSPDLRQYHKSYQRDTWSKVLECFRNEGLHGKGGGSGGGVSKAALKVRFKAFNAMFEEIHKAQSCWVVSDEQLQSELRVSVQAVVVPAYRSFLGRFQQYLDSGRQTEKYIKFGPEELENYIDELFDGNPSSIVRRRT